MKFEIKNLGPLKDAAIELGGLTVVCGKNNCGKTYLAYTLDTFLDTIEYNLNVPLRDPDFASLYTKGEVCLDLQAYVAEYVRQIQETIPRFTNNLPRFLAMDSSRFDQTEVVVPLSPETVLNSLVCPSIDKGQATGVQIEMRPTSTATLVARRQFASTTATISMQNVAEELPTEKVVRDNASRLLARLFNSSRKFPIFPKSFIITSERTGATLFRSDLMSIKVRMDQAHGKVAIPTGYRGYGYQRPVEKDIEFVLELKRFLPCRGEVAERHPEILRYFATIAGGAYDFDESTDQIKFHPKGTNATLSLAESSSTVRALSELFFYLKHKARRGHVLMIDEPEINLHPANQRKLARLFAMLVKAGIRVFVTTHSDYIVREINALIRLGSLSDDVRRQLMERHGYGDVTTLTSEDVKMFVLENGYSHEVPFDHESNAFAVSSFDDTIEQFNSLYDDLMDLGS